MPADANALIEGKRQHSHHLTTSDPIAEFRAWLARRARVARLRNALPPDSTPQWHRRQWECHLYFARLVTFLSCADSATARNAPSGKSSGSSNGRQQGRIDRTIAATMTPAVTSLAGVVRTVDERLRQLW
ncbi:MAG TPA: hypothetical protein VHT28_09470 [Silvibacterium sp.]|nr:hypothetical protein [Silvibacterium sp.]